MQRPGPDLSSLLFTTSRNWGIWMTRSSFHAVKSEGLNFTSMIVKRGSYRNLLYLHLKIWVEKREFKRAIIRWSEEKKKLWSILQRLASALPKKRAMCAIFQKGRKCRFGERCRFSH
ncbi:hypothetical protein SUGI_1175020 [Cryptomeria japonica]|nr:hypothetical protein SUGI_1175020 [Cryptomeria japonica]